MTHKRSPLIVSLAFLVSALAVWSQVDRFFPPTEVPAPVPVAAVAVTEPAPVPTERPLDQRIEVDTQQMQFDGVWEQYSLEGGERQFMARLEMTTDGADYLATPVICSADTFPKQTYRSFDHAFSNGVWTFKEEWGPNEIGEFTLQQQPNGDFVGKARYAGSDFSIDTIFVRIN